MLRKLIDFIDFFYRPYPDMTITLAVLPPIRYSNVPSNDMILLSTYHIVKSGFH